MSQSIQSGKTSVSGNVTTSVSSIAPAQRRTFLVINKPAASETYASTNYASPSDTSDLGMWETQDLATPASLAVIALSTTAKKCRIAFPVAVSIHGRNLEVMFTPASGAGSVTVTVNKIATDGTVTSIGNKTIALATAAPLVANLGITANTALLAGEALEFSFTHGTTLNLNVLYVAFNQS